MSPEDTRHGTINGYCNQKCRCGDCKQAWSFYKRDRLERLKSSGISPDDPRHGSTAGYALSCRCEACSSAQSDYIRSRRSKGLPPGDERHGTETGYSNWGCRCALCLEKAREAKLVRSSSHKSRGLPDPLDSRHGTVNGYKSYGCRCEACRWALRDDKMRYKYGIGADDFDTLLNSQGGVCAACGDAETTQRFRLDHDHTSGEVRGVLCHHCNVALGHLRDDPKRIDGLKDYLMRNVKEMTV